MNDTAEITTAQKVEFLRQPSAYADRPTRVGVIETHMSWVFLTGRFVYKMKKPVQLDFLDFSTLERRRRNCREELRLNRRLAEDVYIEVVPLGADAAGRLSLGGVGEPVEWLVKMRRLARENMLDDAIAGNRVEEAQVRRVAQTLAGFYQRAAKVSLSVDEYMARFRHDIRANDEALSKPEYAQMGVRPGRVAETLQRYMKRHRDVFEARVDSGRIVEAHGDLRPEHVCLTEPPLFIDCLEFNRRFRELDPLDELAFLGLECEFAGAPFIGPMLLDTYRQCSGDDTPQGLTGFYQAFRAQMRAKLAIWHLKDCAPEQRVKWTGSAKSYLRLAAGRTVDSGL